MSKVLSRKDNMMRRERRCGEGMVLMSFFSFLFHFSFFNFFFLAGFIISCVVDQLQGGIIPPAFVSRLIESDSWIRTTDLVI